jgi:DNA helicase-2/ATP-dependent DNA helicase PcrA
MNKENLHISEKHFKYIFAAMKRYGGWYFVSEKEAETISSYLKKLLSDSFHKISVSAFLKSDLDMGRLKGDQNPVLIMLHSKNLLKQKEFQDFVNRLILPLYYMRIPVFFIVKNKNIFEKQMAQEMENISEKNKFHIHFHDILYYAALDQFKGLREIREIRFFFAQNNYKIKLRWMPETIRWHGNTYSKIRVEKDGQIFYQDPDKLTIIPEWILPDNSNQINYFKFEKTASDNDLDTWNTMISENLDTHQLKAVKKVWGPLLVAAPAGSGKTRTLIHKIAYLVKVRGIPSNRILALAFNRKAMEEMKQRLKMMGIHDVSVFTLHAFGYRLLKKYYPDWKFSSDNHDQYLKKILKEALSIHIHISGVLDEDVLQALEEAHKQVKSNLEDPEKIRFKVEDHRFSFGSVFRSLLQIQERRKVFFYEDMIYMAVKLILTRPRLLHTLQNRFPFILVDEYQDLNPAQIGMVRLLSSPGNNVMAVGDDDQLIYDWRGADPEYFLHFHEYFGSSERAVLQKNYRSPVNLVHIASNLIRHNEFRIPKKIQAERVEIMGRIRLYPADDLNHELYMVGRLIQEFHSKNIPFRDIRILTRYHSLALVMAIYLMKEKIPFILLDEEAIYKLPEVRDFRAYLKTILFPEESEPSEIRRILYRPTRYLNWKKIAGIQNIDDLFNLDLGSVPYWRVKRWEDFLMLLRSLMHLVRQKVNPSRIVESIYYDLDVVKLYEQDTRMQNPEEFTGKAFWESMIEMARQYDNIFEYYQNIDNVFGQVSHSEGIRISTIHKTKGNEFDHVILFHMNDPEKDSGQLSKVEMESERRVNYVGITRAKENLAITFLKEHPHSHVRQLFQDDVQKFKERKKLFKKISSLKQELISELKKMNVSPNLIQRMQSVSSVEGFEYLYPELLKNVHQNKKLKMLPIGLRLWELFLFASNPFYS